MFLGLLSHGGGPRSAPRPRVRAPGPAADHPLPEDVLVPLSLRATDRTGITVADLDRAARVRAPDAPPPAFAEPPRS